ncbi:cupin domain-containing protein [Shinella sp.]|uniref:cupin domain-containing protein n=1 Tax=Shinella sp. TaxID=1870904 RepID=UPI00258F3D3B|nr:cupin domain-containing protein [Shinella sp.]MCW5711975.1 cupin domain-containing protein [Shinella sp.]
MKAPVAIEAADVAPRSKPSNYPPQFAERMKGRLKRQLGDLFGLTNFGVNLTTLEPGAVSALQHRHSRQDEFVYILEGEAVLVSGDEIVTLKPGMCAGFPANGRSHHLENRSDKPFLYLEIGDRTEGDKVSYPADDLTAVRESGAWRFTRKDGSPY